MALSNRASIKLAVLKKGTEYNQSLWKYLCNTPPTLSAQGTIEEPRSRSNWALRWNWASRWGCWLQVSVNCEYVSLETIACIRNTTWHVFHRFGIYGVIQQWFQGVNEYPDRALCNQGILDRLVVGEMGDVVDFIGHVSEAEHISWCEWKMEGEFRKSDVSHALDTPHRSNYFFLPSRWWLVAHDTQIIF